MCEMMNLETVDLMVVDLLVKLMSYLVNVPWVGRTKFGGGIGGGIKCNNVMQMKLLYGNVG